MGIFIVLLLFLLLVPLLVVGSTVLRLVFSVRAAFKPNNNGFFTKNATAGMGEGAAPSADDGVIGHSELGRKRLNILKNRATDVQFDMEDDFS